MSVGQTSSLPAVCGSKARKTVQFRVTRRKMLGLGAAGTAIWGLSKLRWGVPEESLSDARLRLLDEIEKRACRYFFEAASPNTGLVRDRARMDGRDDRRVASIAATGFGLSALAIAHSRGYLDRQSAQARVERTLTYLAHSAPHKNGFFYHFLDIETGERVWWSEVSSIDTTWLLCGVLHCRAHFDTPAIRTLANGILDRVNWRWMLRGSATLCHGWTPEGGFLPYRWDRYSEHMAMYLLAIGSGHFRIPPASWHAWARPRRTFAGLTYIDAPAPLFIHQYSHAWFDFRGKHDQYTDYFENSRRATEAHRRFCIQLARQYPWYGANMWGVTASDSRRGYVASGGFTSPSVDGRLVPCASGGSIVFLPDLCATVLETMLDRYGKKVWGTYGFVDAFHPRENWYSPDVIGIDQGIMLLMAENLRSQSVWRAIMSTPEATRAMKAVGLTDRNPPSAI